MLDVAPGWQRIKPSGFIHLVVKANNAGIRQTACGKQRSPNSLTSDFPEGAKRCQLCASVAFARGLEMA
jgi:hypothetical protein